MNSERNKALNDALGVTFNGEVTFNGPMFDIHDNEHVHIGRPEQEDGSGQPAASKAGETHREGEQLTLFIHPSVDSSQEWLVHDQIKRLVQRQGIQEICRYLLLMKSERKVLLPQVAERAYNELVRLGMPDGDGYSLKTFMRYYKR